ncbi:MAG: UDP-2,3-diacylglucosamine diphosphatase [Flavobacteriaceae bacterium]|nr:UDP-2,3-diacylglucosamine diphosphatase [Flavobacteriaceae bacterium]
MKKKIYFASDLHLGAPNAQDSFKRELLFVEWLETIKHDADQIFLIGDMFDFWFEYKTVVPRGFIRFLGKLAELSDSGIVIHFFVGNHDLWLEDYLVEQINLKIYRKPTEFTFQGKNFLIGHGDGLGPGDRGYKIIKKVFVSKIAQFLFRWTHPNVSIGFANYLSLRNKLISGIDDFKFRGLENEWLVSYCHHKLKDKHYDYMIFGHRHLPMEVKLNERSTYINTGDWINHFTYAWLEKGEIHLKKYKKENNSSFIYD